jgi:hypothetical protein
MGCSRGDGEVWPRWAAVASGGILKEMQATRSDQRDASGSIHTTPDPAMGLFITAVMFGLAMLSLFAVLAFANVVALGDVAPFFVVPVLLFIISVVLFLRWIKAEVDEGTVREAAPRK